MRTEDGMVFAKSNNETGWMVIIETARKAELSRYVYLFVVVDDYEDHTEAFFTVLEALRCAMHTVRCFVYGVNPPWEDP